MRIRAFHAASCCGVMLLMAAIVMPVHAASDAGKAYAAVDPFIGTGGGGHTFALGFYPVAPASNQYVIGRPFVRRAVLHLPNGKTFTIIADGLGGIIPTSVP